MNRNYKLYVHIVPNGKRYYGITGTKPKYRWNHGKGYDKNKHFASAIKKYGWNNIQHIILHEGLDKEEAGELEQYMIQWYNTNNPNYGYNISLGGETGNGLYGESHPYYGKHLSEEHRQKISESHKGKIHSDEAKQKMSEKQKGKNNNVARSVICITTNKVFYTLREAANYSNMYYTNIIACCTGRRKSCGKLPDGTKLVWKYIDIIEL
jgi:hypothetical protein